MNNNEAYKQLMQEVADRMGVVLVSNDIPINQEDRNISFARIVDTSKFQTEEEKKSLKNKTSID